MDVIEMTRKLGQAIQEDERYKAYMEACSINDTDVEIQNKIASSISSVHSSALRCRSLIRTARR